MLSSICFFPRNALASGEFFYFWSKASSRFAGGPLPVGESTDSILLENDELHWGFTMIF